MSKDLENQGSKGSQGGRDALTAAGKERSAQEKKFEEALADTWTKSSKENVSSHNSRQETETTQKTGLDNQRSSPASDIVPEKPRRSLREEPKDSSSQQTEKSSLVDKSSSSDSSKGQTIDGSKQQKSEISQTPSDAQQARTSATTGKQAEQVAPKEQVPSSDSPKGQRDIATQPTGGNEGSRAKDSSGRGSDDSSAPKGRSEAPVVTTPESRSDSGAGRQADPRGVPDGSRSDVTKGSDGVRSPEARAPENVRDTSRDTVRDTAGSIARDTKGADSVRDGASRTEAGARDSSREKDVSKDIPARTGEQISKSNEPLQDRVGRQIDKDPVVGKPVDAPIGKALIDQKLDALLVDSKQAGIGGRGADKGDQRDSGHKASDGRVEAGQQVGGRADVGDRGGGRGGDIRDVRDIGERLGLLATERGIGAGRLDVSITADAVKVHLTAKDGQEINLTDKNTQRNLSDAFGLFDNKQYKELAGQFKQAVEFWTELTSKQFNGLKDTIGNVLDAPKAVALKELSNWAQDLVKRPEAPVDPRQELGHAVKMQLLDSLKRQDDMDKRHSDMKEKSLGLIEELKQFKNDMQTRCEDAYKAARSFFSTPIEKAPPIQIVQDNPTRKLTEAEIDDLLNVRLREMLPRKDKEQEAEGKTEDSKSDSQASTQQTTQAPTHVVKKGETISSIAVKYCGMEQCGVLIAEMNRGVVTATYEAGSLVFHAPAGAVLNMPYDRDIREFKEKVLGFASADDS